MTLTRPPLAILTLIALIFYVSCVYSQIFVGVDVEGKIEENIDLQQVNFLEALVAMEEKHADAINELIYETLSPEQVEESINISEKMQELIIIALEILQLEPTTLKPAADVEIDIVHPTYGHLYLERAAVSFQYIEAVFSQNLDYFPREIAESDPIDACTPLSPDTFENKTVYVVRGGCEFGVKALNVVSAKATGMILGNIEQGLFPMRSDNEESIGNVTIPVIMVSSHTRKFIEDLFRRNKDDPEFTLRGLFRPHLYFEDVDRDEKESIAVNVEEVNDSLEEVKDEKSKVPLVPSLPAEEYYRIKEEMREYVSAYSGDAIFGSSKDNLGFNAPFMVSDFGGPLVTKATPYVFLNNDLGCSDIPHVFQEELSGKIAIVVRGGCEIERKVLEMQSRQAIGVILVNNSPGLAQASIKSDNHKGPTVGVAMVHQNALLYLKVNPTGFIDFSITNEHSVDVWEKLMRFSADIQYSWSISPEGRKATHDALVNMYGEDVLKLEYIEYAYEKAEAHFKRMERKISRRKKRITKSL